MPSVHDVGGRAGILGELSNGVLGAVHCGLMAGPRVICMWGSC